MPRSNRFPKAARKKRKDGYAALTKATRLADDLAEFEIFKENILPLIRRDLNAGLTAEEFFKKYAPYAAARGVNIALTHEDKSAAINMIKDILDRTQGKAVTREEHSHKYEQLSDSELDAMILTKIQEDEPGKAKKS